MQPGQVFFSSRSFLNRRSLRYSDCFIGQSPGIGRNELAISIPVCHDFDKKNRYSNKLGRVDRNDGGCAAVIFSLVMFASGTSN